MEIIWPGRTGTFLNIALGYSLILVTIWSTRAVQRKLFWIDVAFFLSVAALGLYRSPGARKSSPGDAGLDGLSDTSDSSQSSRSQSSDFSGLQSSSALARFFRQRFRLPELDLPPLHFSIIMIGLGLITAVAVVLASAEIGTLHGLFGNPHPVLHGGIYVVWAVVQQWIQQSFFFVRMERIIQRGILASFTTAALFGLAHLPNPVLTPLTFLGGWLLSELYRRYRTLIPLGIAHGLVGLSIALSVPDSVNHHMRVGLGYLHYMS